MKWVYCECGCDQNHLVEDAHVTEVHVEEIGKYLCLEGATASPSWHNTWCEDPGKGRCPQCRESGGLDMALLELL